jgi:hypothetical protein
LHSLVSVPVIARIFNPKAKSCSIQHRRLTLSDSLEGLWKWLDPQCRVEHT